MKRTAIAPLVEAVKKRYALRQHRRKALNEMGELIRYTSASKKKELSKGTTF
jgi:hypothetical protein